jgi:hypothetical protein
VKSTNPDPTPDLNGLSFYPHGHRVTHRFEPLASLFQSIWPGFSQWLTTVTIFDFV